MENDIRVLITEQEVEEKIRQMADRINADYQGKQLHLIGVLRGSVFFVCELAKRLSIPVTIDFMSVASYGNGTQSSGAVHMLKDLDDPLEGKDVLLAEDIIDSGRTLHYLMDLLRKRHPASLKLATLLDKPDRREIPVKADYTGFEIPDKFVVGYGLDYAQKYRNLPFIGVLEDV